MHLQLLMLCSSLVLYVNAYALYYSSSTLVRIQTALRSSMLKKKKQEQEQEQQQRICQISPVRPGGAVPLVYIGNRNLC